MPNDKVRLLTCERAARYERVIRTTAWLAFRLPAVWVRQVLDDPAIQGGVLLVRYLGVIRRSRVIAVAHVVKGGRRVVWFKPAPADRFVREEYDE